MTRISFVMTTLVCMIGCIVLGATGRIAIVLDGFLGDLSYNDMGYKGAAEAAQDFDLELCLAQSASVADILTSLREMARQEQYEVIIAVGFLLKDATAQVADEFPDQRFIIVDGEVPGKSNVMSIQFRENETAALIGALAGMAAAHHSYECTGMVLGIESPLLYRYEAGYRFGLSWGLRRFEETVGLHPEVGLLYTYTGTFYDISAGLTAANSILAMGSVSIFNVAGVLGLGELDAIDGYHEYAGTTYGPPYFFGVVANQDYLLGGYHGLASAMKRIDKVTYNAIESVVNGDFKGGIVEFGLAEDAVGISELDDLVEFIQFGIDAQAISPDSFYSILANWASNRSTIPTWIWSAIEELEAGIRDSSIVVPTASSHAEIVELRAIYEFNAY